MTRTNKKENTKLATSASSNHSTNSNTSTSSNPSTNSSSNKIGSSLLSSSTSSAKTTSDPINIIGPQPKKGEKKREKICNNNEEIPVIEENNNSNQAEFLQQELNILLHEISNYIPNAKQIEPLDSSQLGSAINTTLTKYNYIISFINKAKFSKEHKESLNKIAFILVGSYKKFIDSIDKIKPQGNLVLFIDGIAKQHKSLEKAFDKIFHINQSSQEYDHIKIVNLYVDIGNQNKTGLEGNDISVIHTFLDTGKKIIRANNNQAEEKSIYSVLLAIYLSIILKQKYPSDFNKASASFSTDEIVSLIAKTEAKKVKNFGYLTLTIHELTNEANKKISLPNILKNYVVKTTDSILPNLSKINFAELDFSISMGELENLLDRYPDWHDQTKYNPNNFIKIIIHKINSFISLKEIIDFQKKLKSKLLNESSTSLALDIIFCMASNDSKDQEKVAKTINILNQKENKINLISKINPLLQALIIINYIKSKAYTKLNTATFNEFLYIETSSENRYQNHINYLGNLFKIAYEKTLINGNRLITIADENYSISKVLSLMIYEMIFKNETKEDNDIILRCFKRMVINYDNVDFKIIHQLNQSENKNRINNLYLYFIRKSYKLNLSYIDEKKILKYIIRLGNIDDFYLSAEELIESNSIKPAEIANIFKHICNIPEFFNKFICDCENLRKDQDLDTANKTRFFKILSKIFECCGHLQITIESLSTRSFETILLAKYILELHQDFKSPFQLGILKTNLLNNLINYIGNSKRDYTILKEIKKPDDNAQTLDKLKYITNLAKDKEHQPEFFKNEVLRLFSSDNTSISFKEALQGMINDAEPMLEHEYLLAIFARIFFNEAYFDKKEDCQFISEILSKHYRNSNEDPGIYNHEEEVKKVYNQPTFTCTYITPILNYIKDQRSTKIREITTQLMVIIQILTDNINRYAPYLNLIEYLKDNPPSNFDTFKVQINIPMEAYPIDLINKTIVAATGEKSVLNCAPLSSPTHTMISELLYKLDKTSFITNNRFTELTYIYLDFLATECMRAFNSTKKISYLMNFYSTFIEMLREFAKYSNMPDISNTVIEMIFKNEEFIDFVQANNCSKYICNNFSLEEILNFHTIKAENKILKFIIAAYWNLETLQALFNDNQTKLIDRLIEKFPAEQQAHILFKFTMENGQKISEAFSEFVFKRITQPKHSQNPANMFISNNNSYKVSNRFSSVNAATQTDSTLCSQLDETQTETDNTAYHSPIPGTSRLNDK
jgi:hypothetical protein